MRVLLDTNVLCRLAGQGHPLHLPAERTVTRLYDEGHELCLVPQVLYEYWVVVTRPVSDNSLGMATSDVNKAIDHWLALFTLLRDERGIFPNWRQLATQHELKGKSAHDARLVAAMQRHGLKQVLTFNVADFRRYTAIEILDAGSLAAT